MMDLVAKKSTSGDISINLAQSLVESHEWGLALRALNEGLQKGGLSDPERAHRLFDDLCQRLGIRGRECQSMAAPGLAEYVEARSIRW